MMTSQYAGRRRAVVAILGFSMALGHVAAGTARAAPPVNDACANAIPIGNGATQFDTSQATTDGPSHQGTCQWDGQTYNDIWFLYISTCTGNLTVSTCGTASYDTDLVVYNGCNCGSLALLGCNDDYSGCSNFTSKVTVPVNQGNCYLIRVGGYQAGDRGAGTVNISCTEPGQVLGACCFGTQTCTILTQSGCVAQGGTFMGQDSVCTAFICSASVGPDVILSSSSDTAHYGPVGGIHAYTIGSNTCNIGSQNLLWSSSNTPGLAMNGYRLKDGRLMQIGMSWCKTACCAGASNGCGMSCNGAGGSMLGAGCLDTYGAGYNAGQGKLAKRSGVNAFSGAFQSADGGGTSTVINRRLQIAQTDLDPAQNPGALYFLEGIYVGSDDAASHNGFNNASYGRATVNATYSMTYASVMHATMPAIYAWQEHGLGVNTPDPDVHIETVDVPGEGRYYVGSKAVNLGGGNWRYEYAVYNLNSDRSGGSLTVWVPNGATVSNTGFHDVDYHSGDPYDNADWTTTVTGTSVRWSSPQTFSQNANSNALRWGTLYNFWFQANAAPTMGVARLGLFKTGTPDAICAPAMVPTVCTLSGDINADNQVDGRDIRNFIECVMSGVTTGGNCPCADTNQDCNVDMNDLSSFVSDALSN